MRGNLLRAGILVLTVMGSIAHAAENVEASNPEWIAERPGVEGEATQVKIGVYLMDIDEIDDVRQRFSVDMFLRVSWQDPRLVIPEGAPSIQYRIFPLDDIWSPKGLIVNDRGLNPQLQRVARVDALGNVVYRMRFYGELLADMDLKEFPFDSQILPIQFVSYEYRPDELQFVLDGDINDWVKPFSVEGWEFKILQPEFHDFSVPAAGIALPQFTFRVQAQRNSQYYFLTMFLPMTFIVLMAWSAFWLQPNLIPSRIAISTATIFSLLAFGFSIRMNLPRISYMTRADLFVSGCMLLVFLALAVTVTVSRWANSDRMTEALRLNAVAGWAYLGLFALVAVITMVT
ncbi:MAG: hypothetical protein MUP90_04955 [Gammaproteobacteria bacterium]|nr:hypothetical protein [Gammaproteobacteria bacterium]